MSACTSFIHIYVFIIAPTNSRRILYILNKGILKFDCPLGDHVFTSPDSKHPSICKVTDCDIYMYMYEGIKIKLIAKAYCKKMNFVSET